MRVDADSSLAQISHANPSLYCHCEALISFSLRLVDFSKCLGLVQVLLLDTRDPSRSPPKLPPKVTKITAIPGIPFVHQAGQSQI